MDITFRNDDVSTNTDIYATNLIYDEIKKSFPTSKIISGVTILSKKNSQGSVYDEVPFKDNPVSWFYNIDSAMSGIIGIPGMKCSHGLFHIDHSMVSREVQELSIVSSCNFLGTQSFIPPFNRYNDDTIDICDKNNIEIICTPFQDWKSLEHEKFDPEHKYWYFHSWRWNNIEIKKLFAPYAMSLV